ncbi:MAG: AEC family transporter [Opitutales bacterium]
MLVLNVLAPVFLLIGTGALLQYTGFTSPGFLKEANRLTYWLGLPALLFSQLVSSYHDAHGAALLLSVVFTATGVLILVAYLTGWLMRVPGPALGTFVQGSFRGNLAFVGLPVIYAFPDTPLASGLSLRAAAVIIVAPTMVLYNVGAVVVLLLSQHRLGWRMVWPLFRQLATTPPLLGTLAGVGFAMAGWTLPPSLDKAFTALGEMALPLGLLGVGGSLVTVKLGTTWIRPLAAALLKTAALPFIGWLLARAWGLSAAETRLVAIFLATPTAVISYTMAVEMKGDEPIAAGSIVLSVVSSLLALILIIALL